MKVYITRDEGDEWVWLWLKPAKGPLIPTKIPDCGMIAWYRPGTNISTETDAYTVDDFKLKFGITLKEKIKRLVDLPKEKVNSEDYKIFSSDGDRKQ